MTATVKDLALIKGVLALIGMERDDSRYRQQAQAVLDLCAAALHTPDVRQDETPKAAAPPAVTTTPGNLGVRIAELAAHGKGVREIARILAVHPSTVSRRLRNTLRNT